MARLPDDLLRPFAGDFTIEVHLIKPRLRYPLAAPAPAAAPAQVGESPALGQIPALSPLAGRGLG
jgi:hypothetical protein